MTLTPTNVNVQMAGPGKIVRPTLMIAIQIPVVNMESVLTRLEAMSVNVIQDLKEHNVKRTLMSVTLFLARIVAQTSVWISQMATNASVFRDSLVLNVKLTSMTVR